MAASTFDIEIDAPDGAAAIDLELRLSHLTPATIGRGADWIVEIPGPADLAEIAVVVRDWLGDIGQPTTTIRAEGHILRIENAGARRLRTPVHTFIG